MSAFRVEFVDLSTQALPYKLPLLCHSWKLWGRVKDSSQARLNGVLLNQFAVGFDASNSLYLVEVGVEPVFDAQGVPVPWNDELVFNNTTFGDNVPVVVMLVYYDTSLAAPK